MSETADKIKNFNLILEELLKQTSELIGTSYSYYFSKLIQVNSTLPITNGIKYMLPHREKIMARDETYFTEDTTFLSTVEKSKFPMPISTDAILVEIFRLKDIYYKLDESSRGNLWDTVQALTVLMMEYCDLKGIKY